MDEQTLQSKGFIKQPDGSWSKAGGSPGSAGHPAPGPHPGNQEQHVRDRKKGKSGMEKEVRRQFEITVTLKFADGRTRDPDAALSTILDCLIACRRQLEVYSSDSYAVYQSEIR